MSSLTMPDALVDALRGTLTGPGDPDYDERRKLYNAMIDKRPALIARCANADDHQDHADCRDLEPRDVRVDGEVEDRADGDQEE